jgi:hypothetical protein
LLSDTVSHPKWLYLQQHCYKNLKSHIISAISCRYKITLCAVYSLKSYNYELTFQHPRCTLLLTYCQVICLFQFSLTIYCNNKSQQHYCKHSESNE